MTKEEFANNIEQSWCSYWNYDGCKDCVGNGCDDCRDCEIKSYKNNLYQKVKNLEERFFIKYGITYKDYKTKMNDYLNKDMGYHTFDKKKYMNAEEAYNLTTDTIEYTKERLLEATMSKIDKAARKGEYIVHIYENFSKVVIDELRNLGYEVINNYSQHDGDDFIIKWMKPYADKK